MSSKDERSEEKEECSSVLWEETQHYGYRVIAQHILAVCYYAKNYGSEQAFQRWDRYLDGYCKKIEIPERGSK